MYSYKAASHLYKLAQKDYLVGMESIIQKFTSVTTAYWSNIHLEFEWAILKHEYIVALLLNFGLLFH